MTGGGGWVAWAGGTQAIVQALAILAAGGWAYFKYLHGQPFTSRAVLTIDARVVDLGELRALSLRVELKNVGERRMDLGEKGLEVHGVTTERWTTDQPLHWGQPLNRVAVLPLDDWVEAREALSDEVLVPVPRTGPAFGDFWLTRSTSIFSKPSQGSAGCTRKRW